MKKKISLPIVIAIVLLVSALVFTIAYRTAIKNMNAKLTDLNEKQQMYSNLAAVDDFVRENSFYDANEGVVSRELCAGLVKGYEGRVLFLTAEEFANSIYTGNEYIKMIVADGNVIVVLTEAQFNASITMAEPVTSVPAETESIDE